MSVTLDILEIGARGDGIAEHDGQRWFVPFTLPGETVEAEARGKRGEGIAAELLEVVAPSRHRESPPCAHFKVCGGCALQHWRRDAYTAWKVELIVHALSQRGVDAPRFEAPLVAIHVVSNHETVRFLLGLATVVEMVGDAHPDGRHAQQEGDPLPFDQLADAGAVQNVVDLV